MKRLLIHAAVVIAMAAGSPAVRADWGAPTGAPVCAAPSTTVVVGYQGDPACCCRPGLLQRICDKLHGCDSSSCCTCCTPCACSSHPILDKLHAIRCKLTPPCLRGPDCDCCAAPHHPLFDCFHRERCCPQPACPPSVVAVPLTPPPPQAALVAPPAAAPAPAPVVPPAPAPVPAAAAPPGGPY
jgi:hypothetical protein